MKKKIFVILLVMVLWPLATMAEDNADINVSVDVSQGQILAGGKGKGDTRIRSFINPYIDTEFLPPPATYPPGKVVPYTERISFPYDELDQGAPEQLVQKYRKQGLIVQFNKVAHSLGHNNKEVYLLARRPRKNPLWVNSIEGPPNALLSEIVRRAVSLAKAATGTDRIFVTVEMALNPRNAGNALSFGGASSFLPGTSALAFGAQPQIGESESRVYKVPQVTVYSYGPNVPITQPIAQKNKEDSKPKIILFSGNNMAPEVDKVIKYNVEWLAQRLEVIEKEKLQIRFIGFGQNSFQIARKAMITIGRKLCEKGFSPEKVANLLLAEGRPITPKLNPLQPNITGVVMIKITK